MNWLITNKIKLLAYGAAALAFIALIAFGWQAAKGIGRNEERVDTLTKITNDVRKAHAIQDKTRTLPVGAAAKQLSVDWSRD